MFKAGQRVSVPNNMHFPDGIIEAAALDEWGYNTVRHDDGTVGSWFNNSLKLVEFSYPGGYKPGQRIKNVRTGNYGTVLPLDVAKSRRSDVRERTYVYVEWDYSPRGCAGMYPSSLERLEDSTRLEDTDEYKKGYAAALDDAEDKLNVFVDRVQEKIDGVYAEVEEGFNVIDELRRGAPTSF